MPGPDHRLAYETALRALDQQERMFDTLRTRAGTLLAAGSLAISLFASDPAASPGAPLMTIGALVAYLVCFSASLRILTPTFDAGFACSPITVASWEQAGSESEVYTKAVREMNQTHATNGAAARVLASHYRLAAIGLTAETVLLVTQLVATII